MEPSHNKVPPSRASRLYGKHPRQNDWRTGSTSQGLDSHLNYGTSLQGNIHHRSLALSDPHCHDNETLLMLSSATRLHHLARRMYMRESELDLQMDQVKTLRAELERRRGLGSRRHDVGVAFCGSGAPPLPDNAFCSKIVSHNEKESKEDGDENKPKSKERVDKQHAEAEAIPDTTSSVSLGPNHTFPPAAGQGLGLAQPSDQNILSDFQILLRQSLEFFEVQPADLAAATRRRKELQAGQVGLRCRYCAHRPMHWRGRGAVYYPRSLSNIYQAAQNMGIHHFLETCADMPPAVQKKISEARQKQIQEIRRSGGKTYWTETSRLMGLEDREGQYGVWFKSTTGTNAT